jgi:hypothetical protein
MLATWVSTSILNVPVGIWGDDGLSCAYRALTDDNEHEAKYESSDETPLDSTAGADDDDNDAPGLSVSSRLASLPRSCQQACEMMAMLFRRHPNV